MKKLEPSKTVLLGAGWSHDNIFYELVQLPGGFFELRWARHSSSGIRAQGPGPIFDHWFGTREEAMVVFSNVVVLKSTLRIPVLGR